jgi:pectinesterase
MMRLLLFFIFTLLVCHVGAKNYDNPDTLVVARDGTGEFRTVNEAIEVCRAFMEYHKVIYVKKGIYKEKLVLPSWLTNIEICGEDRDNTIITYDDHANITSPDIIPGKLMPIGTFRTYTLKIEGSDIMLSNITIENNSARLGQAVALHTEGDRLQFINCRFLGHQDTVYTGAANTHLLFADCYIEGTTDFIFGPSTAWFDCCTIHCKANSYITAASTPKNVKYGYVFNKCTITLAPNINNVYLGRPWRDYAYTVFMNCTFPATGIRPEGWHDWNKPHDCIRYAEYNNHTSSGSVGSSKSAAIDTSHRAPWSRQLSEAEAKEITVEKVLGFVDIVSLQ